MLVFISIPYNARYHENSGTHLWFFYKQIGDLADQIGNVTFMGWEKNYVFPDLIPDDSWEKNSSVQEKLEYRTPSTELLSQAKIISVDQNIFLPLEEKLKSNNLVWHYLITQEYEPLKNFVREQLEEIKKNNSIEAIVLCCNSPSVKAVGKELDIPVIHTEIGPTRKPQYLQTAYWDLSGVNGKTDAERRFSAAHHELVYSNLSKKELRALLMSEADFAATETLADSHEYPIGVAGQVDDDSNIIAYSNGFNNLEILKYANYHFGKENVLFRSHPGAQICFSATLDRSSSPMRFFKRIEKLITINSSMAMEACLLEKPVMVLGDSPFKLLSDDLVNGAVSADGHIDELNFLCLNYIIPYELIFNYDYYVWRLGNPTETEIRNYHLKYYLSQKGFADVEDLRKNIPTHTAQPPVVLAESDTLLVSVGDIPYRLQNESELKKEVLSLKDDVKHYQHKFDEFTATISELKGAYEYNKKEAENFKALWEYQQSETKVFKEAYEYNESEAKRLAELLPQETAKYQSVIDQQQKRIEYLERLLEKKPVKLALKLFCKKN